jgi:hypothetical protein
MAYCGNPLTDQPVDFRFMDTYETSNSIKHEIKSTINNYVYKPENDVDYTLGIKQYNTVSNQSWWESSVSKLKFW